MVKPGKNVLVCVTVFNILTSVNTGTVALVLFMADSLLFHDCD